MVTEDEGGLRAGAAVRAGSERGGPAAPAAATTPSLSPSPVSTTLGGISLLPISER